MEAFPPFKVDMAFVKKAESDCIVMHYLSAHNGYEITGEVTGSPPSMVSDRAGNGMHA